MSALICCKPTAIFTAQGSLQRRCQPQRSRLVVGNPANTNAYIAQKSAPDLPAKNFTSMLRLDHNRALSQLAAKTGVKVADIKKLVVWGNHSPTMYPDVRFANANGKAISGMIDDAWNNDVFIPTVGKRGAAIIDARGVSSAASAANAAIDHMRDWALGTNGEWVTLSDGTYAFLKASSTCCRDLRQWRIHPRDRLDIDASRARMDKTLKELTDERRSCALLG